MAHLGVSKPWVAKYEVENGNTVKYTDADVLAKAVSVSLELDNNDAVKLYADNGVAESASAFSSGTLTLGVDDLSLDMAGRLLGLTVETNTTPAGSVIKYKDTVAPYLGFGVIVKRIKGGQNKWIALVLPKVQFRTPALSVETQGETIAFQTPELEAVVMRDDTVDGHWRYDGEFATETDAESYVKKTLGVE